MKALIYHVFHIGGVGKHSASDFIVVIEDGNYVVLTNISFPPGFGNCYVFSVAVRRAKRRDVCTWRGRVRRRDTCCQRTRSAVYAQKY